MSGLCRHGPTLRCEYIHTIKTLKNIQSQVLRAPAECSWISTMDPSLFPIKSCTPLNLTIMAFVCIVLSAYWSSKLPPNSLSGFSHLKDFSNLKLPILVHSWCESPLRAMGHVARMSEGYRFSVPIFCFRDLPCHCEQNFTRSTRWEDTFIAWVWGDYSLSWRHGSGGLRWPAVRKQKKPTPWSI